MAEYIERERALEELKYSGCGSAYRDLATRRIMAIPAADVAPVVRGRWKVNGINPHNGTVGNFRCSVCDGVSLNDSDYCPNCGAEMEKEGTNA